MTNQNISIPPAAQLPATRSFDAHGFDPDDFEWVPLPKIPRSDGWTPERQRTFIEALADCGSVTQAARKVNMTTMSCYRLRRQPGAENFAAAWEAAIAESARVLVDIAMDRAINGVAEPVLDRDGTCIHVRTRINDRLLMFLLRAHHPERYGLVGHGRGLPRITVHGGDLPAADCRLADAPPNTALDTALLRLDPAMPADPLHLLSPQRFADLLPLPDLAPPTPDLPAPQPAALA